MLSKIISTCVLLSISNIAYSNDEVVAQITKSDPMSGSYLLQLVIGLIVVILCIVALAWLAKKMNRLQTATDESLKILGGISMGSRERVVLLQVGEEQLLVGVSPGHINTLHVLETPIENSIDDAGNVAGGDFSKKFKRLMMQANKKSPTENK